MIGTERVTLFVPRLSKIMHFIFHVLEQTSQPVILGTQSGISLDFSDPGKCSDIVCHRNYKVTCRTSIVLSPESEAVVFASISSQNVHPGVQGICTHHQSFSKSDMVSCKCVGVVSIDNAITVKLLNATSSPIVLDKGNKIVR